MTKANLNQSLIIITPNSTDYGGICQIWDDGSAIAFCPRSTYGYPLDTRGVIQHEAGGHGFGKLGAISRESIVKRIKRYAGEEYSFEEFVKNDKGSVDIKTRAMDAPYAGSRVHTFQYPPKIHKGSPLK